MWARKLLRPLRAFSKLHVVDAQYMGHLGASSIYLLENDRNEILCIDPGVTSSIRGPLRHFFDTHPELSLQYVVVTHAHLDHHGGVGHLLQNEPFGSNAVVLCHPSTVPHLLDPSHLISGTRALYGDEIYDSAVGEVDPILDSSRVVDLHNGCKIDFYENLSDLCAYWVRGHTNNHLVLHDVESQSLFAGDAFGMAFQGGKKHVPCWPPTAFVPHAAREAVEFQMSLPEVDRVFVTHFGELDTTTNVLSSGEYLLDELDQFECWINDVQKFVQDRSLLSPYMTEKELKMMAKNKLNKKRSRTEDEIIVDSFLIPSMLDRYVDDAEFRDDDRWRHIMWLNAEGVLFAAKRQLWNDVIRTFFDVVHVKGQVDRVEEFAHPEITHISSMDEIEHVGIDVMVETIHNMHAMFGNEREVSLSLKGVEDSTFSFELEYSGTNPDGEKLVLRSNSEWTVKDDKIFYARANVIPPES